MLERVALDTLALFLAPFALFAVYLIVRLRWPLATEHWPLGRVSALTLAGLALALAGFVAAEVFAPRGHGTYVPAHVDNGILVPGHFE